jgi:hypothetical protein
VRQLQSTSTRRPIGSPACTASLQFSDHCSSSSVTHLSFPSFSPYLDYETDSLAHLLGLSQSFSSHRQTSIQVSVPFIRMSLSSFCIFIYLLKTIRFPSHFSPRIPPTYQHVPSLRSNLSPIGTTPIQAPSPRRRPRMLISIEVQHLGQHPPERRGQSIHLLPPFIIDTCMFEDSANNECREDAAAACCRT